MKCAGQWELQDVKVVVLCHFQWEITLKMTWHKNINILEKCLNRQGTGATNQITIPRPKVNHASWYMGYYTLRREFCYKIYKYAQVNQI